MTPKNSRLLRIALFMLFLLPSAASAQFLPANAHGNLYFPQIVDGGSAAQRWQTAINVTNPTGAAALVEFEFYASDGGPLNLDFGDGISNTLSIAVPASGSRTVRTQLASEQILSGWGFGDASVPVLATLTFTQIVDGVPKLSVTAPPSLPGSNYLYPANYFLSVAVANYYIHTSVVIPMTVRDSTGEIVAQDNLILPPEGQTAFTLWQRFPSLAPDFEGSLRLGPALARQPLPGLPLFDYISWGMGADSSGVISGLPSGQFKAPQSQWDEIWRVFQTLMVQAPEYIGPGPVDLSISFQPVVNAGASNGSNVMVTLGLAELLADSPSELAFAIAHELGHIYQQRTGRMEFRPDNAESDADIWGVLFTLFSGYDPYAIAGTLGKLAMATDNANLAGQFFEDLTFFDAHKSFSTRIADSFDTLQWVCTLPEWQETCKSYKTFMHPHLPASAPLMEIPPISSKRR